MAYLRATTILLAMFVFLCLTPLQWVALRRRWPLRRWFPVAFGRTLANLLRLDVCAECAAPPGSHPQEPRLIAANHVSWLDILAFCSVEPVCFLAKREIGAWPLISTFARLQETVFVDRQRRHAIPSTNAAMAQRMLSGRPMLLFPEATTGDGTALRKFHSSHFAAARDLLSAASGVERVLGATCRHPLFDTGRGMVWGCDLASTHLVGVEGRAHPLRSHLRQAIPLRTGR